MMPYVRRIVVPFLVISQLALLADDRFFPIANSAQTGATITGVPSVNNKGDVVVRLVMPSIREIRFYRFEDQRTTAQGALVPFQVVRSSSGTLGAFPVINDHRSVATYNSASGFQVIQRFTYIPNANPSLLGTFSAVAIARGEVTQPAGSPFAFLSPVMAIDNTPPAPTAPGGTPDPVAEDRAYLTFYGERTPFSAPYTSAIYVSNVGVPAGSNSTPSTIIASAPTTPPTFTSLEPYVAASGDVAKAVFRGVSTTDAGVFSGSPVIPVFSTGTSFSTVGTRPGINGAGVIASYAVYTGAAGGPVEGVFLKNSAGELRRAGNPVGGTQPDLKLSGFGEQPGAYGSTNRIALNDFGQVAYVATDALLRSSIFTTNLGRSRRLVSVGDTFTAGTTVETIAGLQLYDGLKTNGQIVFWASTDGGRDYLLKANRAYNQAKLTDTPILPSYWDTGYLKRKLLGVLQTSDYINALGCNLVSTANILSVYGFDFSPGQFNQWLLDRWSSPPAGTVKDDYITGDSIGGDFPDEVVELLSNELRLNDLSKLPVRFIGVHNPGLTGAVTNLQRIITELRAGFPVKLRVPNGNYQKTPTKFKAYTPDGHFVIAYGLSDPSKTVINKDDILIHDPGNGGIYTLGDYGTKLPKDSIFEGPPLTVVSNEKYDDHNPDWLETDVYKGVLKSAPRVFIYRPIDPSTPLPAKLFLYLTTSPIAAAASQALASQTVNSTLPSDPAVFIVVKDAGGNRLGIVPGTGEVRELGGSYLHDSSYTGLDGTEGDEVLVWGDLDIQRIALDALVSGTYSIELVGGLASNYRVYIGGSGDVSVNSRTFSGSISPGETQVLSFSASTGGPVAHSADIDENFRLSLLELTRVIELYNTRNGTTRTGCYKVDAAGEDGFAPDPARAIDAVVSLPFHHSADSNQDGKVSLLELTRVIELYNYRAGTTRTGEYHVQAGTEDGFAPGP